MLSGTKRPSGTGHTPRMRLNDPAISPHVATDRTRPGALSVVVAFVSPKLQSRFPAVARRSSPQSLTFDEAVSRLDDALAAPRVSPGTKIR